MKSIKPMKKLTLGLTLSLGTALFLSGCASTDVVGQTGMKSFNALTTLTQTNSVSLNDEAFWKINTPDGQGLYLSTDGTKDKDAILEIKAQPFLDAGLQPDALKGWNYDSVTGMLTWSADLSKEKYGSSAEKSPSEAFNALIKANREAIGYHTALDHYGIGLGEGNMFEWAKDDTTNDKDMVLVLNPEPFILAGVDTTLLKGWIFTKVEVLDEKDNPIQVDKFLSPYELSK